jgi:hypothetical protein
MEKRWDMMKKGWKKDSISIRERETPEEKKREWKRWH